VKSLESIEFDGVPTPPKKRAWVKLDKYAFDYFDYFDLSPSERHVLLAVCLEVRWQDFAWHGSLTDLSGRTRMTRSHVKKAMESLVAKGILEAIHPFKSNSMGEFHLVHYHDLIIPEVRSGGRPTGSKDSYPRRRYGPTRTERDDEVTTMRTRTEPDMNGGERIGNTNSLMSGGNRYNTHREAENREDVNGVTSFRSGEIKELPDSSNSPQSLNSNSNVLCKICHEEEWGHSWASADGRGHDYVPDLEGYGYVDF